ncbi:Gfo/Idh/MocA family oxidoreductase [Chitiniphilus purpureus]|uniref:Gfo/Idh/MocA family oxidoreductase n=1 Tax=Chitiniphilus purpureus TaxID=2981137 RepID=A0ABY6DQE1_9NEIS|nr:Gfo/Idh/MocA family oxidoreductase [Chitiniphilus sp. CD1]UXY15938.1 Gfo/Idh/MocA family oxidoreductase [Chitiniphilus sp. CD1]
MHPLRFGIIGTGSIARRFAHGLRHVPDAALAAVWNRTPGKAQAFADEFGGVVCASFDALLAQPLDAVYIATPHPGHAPYSVAALEAGKAVLCEKPAATSQAELERVLAVAAAHGVLFMEAMKPPFYPLFAQLDDHLRRDPIGPITLVRAGFASPGVPATHAVYDPAQAGGALLDIGVYAAFLAVHWLGPAQTVAALGRLGPSGVDTLAVVNTSHAQGCAQLYCGLGLSGSGEALLAAPGGHVLIHEKWWNPERATIRYPDGRTVLIEAPAVGGGLNYEAAHFCGLLRAGLRESPVMDHAKSRAMLALLDAARAQLGLVYPFER